MHRDERGAVYVEFLLAFLPLFFIFLALCQVALLVAGKLVVSHAAFNGARSAIVVLDDDPARYAGAPRGVLSHRKAAKPDTEPSPASQANQAARPQQGARMQAIRGAAMRPLLAIAPSAAAFFGGRDVAIAESLKRDQAAARGFARAYSEAATVVSVHGAAAQEQLASEPILANTPVTLRVTYLQLCAIPLVRSMICSSLSTLLEASEDGKLPPGLTGKSKTSLGRRLELAGLPDWLETTAGAGSRFMVFEAEVTLPNQGARYEYTEP